MPLEDFDEDFPRSDEFRFFDSEELIWRDIPLKIGSVSLDLNLPACPVSQREGAVVGEISGFIEPFLPHSLYGKTYRSVKEWINALRARDIFVDCERYSSTYFRVRMIPDYQERIAQPEFNELLVCFTVPEVSSGDVDVLQASFSLDLTMPLADRSAITSSFVTLPNMYLSLLEKYSPDSRGVLEMEVFGSGQYFNHYLDVPDMRPVFERILRERIRRSYELPEVIEYDALVAREEWVDVRWMVTLNPNQRRKLGEVPAEWETVIGPADEPHLHVIRAPFHPASFELDDWLMWVKFLEPVTGPRLISEETLAEIVEFRQRRGFLYPPFPPRPDATTTRRSE